MASKSLFGLLASGTGLLKMVKPVNNIRKLPVVFQNNHFQLIFVSFHVQKCKTSKTFYKEIYNWPSHIYMSEWKMQAQAWTATPFI